MAHEMPNIPFPHNPDESFSDGLSQIYARRTPVPAAQDQAIREAIHQHFATSRKQRHWNRRFAPWAAVAATVVIAASVWLLTQPPQVQPSAQAQTNPLDLDRNGRINILDAFLLARNLEMNQPSDGKLDVNGDGAVDARDVDLIALQAVALNGGGQS